MRPNLSTRPTRYAPYIFDAPNFIFDAPKSNFDAPKSNYDVPKLWLCQNLKSSELVKQKLWTTMIFVGFVPAGELFAADFNLSEDYPPESYPSVELPAQ